ncbi:MAG TPA: SelL-related redox protein [Fimbriiglobus sp.]|nr:SelL-related redox protein [Fimbriiglobus sp.]
MAHLGEVAANGERLRAASVGVLAVSQATPAVLATFLRDHPQPVPVVCDPDRAGYRAFGLERTSWLSFFRPSVMGGYLRLMFRGGKVRRPYPGEDVLQLGGDFLLDRAGRVVFAYPSRTATDRPGVDVLLAAAS